MRGIVSLAAAMSLPTEFPYRNLILLTAFSDVLGTMVIQGLTLNPLLRTLDLRDDDPVGREERLARGRALEAALASLAEDSSSCAEIVRQYLKTRLAHELRASSEERDPLNELHRRALRASREAVLAMRARGEISDDAFHRIEEELDWLEMANAGDTQ